MFVLPLLVACMSAPPDDAFGALPAAMPAGPATAALDWSVTPQRPAPMSLTAADGSGLKLSEVHVNAVVTDPLAFTELHLVFDNPEDRRIEGRFEITLPPGAAISRFAMKLGDHWQEGEVVERKAARRAYEDILHQRSDPALLEHDAGNTFRARVFPIEPKASKELILSWSHDLDADEPWALPTGGLPELGKLTADVAMGGDRYRFESEYFVPEGDLVLQIPRKQARLALRGGDVAVVRVVPELSVKSDRLQDATFLIDTSASRALSLADDLTLLQAVIASLSASAQVRVLAYDQQVLEVYDGKAKGFSGAALDKIRKRQALGASDLSAALARAGGSERVVVFTDGVATAGETGPGKLAEAIRGLEDTERLDAIVSGGARDEAALAAFVTAGLTRHGVVLDADTLDDEEVARRLSLGASGALTVDVPGAEWFWPTEVRGLQPGDSFVVHADLPADAPLSVRLDGKDIGPIDTADAAGPLVERAAAQAEIARLFHQEGLAAAAEEREALAAEIVEVSTTWRVLSPHTALLVLESEADYERFGIPRNALADILTVTDGKLGWIERKDPVLPEASSGLDEPEDDSRDADEPPDEGVKAKKAEAMDEERSVASRAREERPRRRPPAQRPPRTSRSDPAPEVAADGFAEGEVAAEVSEEEDEASPQNLDPLAAWEGRYREVMVKLLAGDSEGAEALARAWRAESPGDPLALLALGEVLQRKGAAAEAARVYGSLIDLFPSRADLRRLAGERLEALGEPGWTLAADTFRVARTQRPDHPAAHRLLAWTLVKQNLHADALQVIEDGLKQEFGRFEAAHRILREDAGLIAAAWAATGEANDLDERLKRLEATQAEGHSLRFVLNWETDANDVDFHIYDAKGGHAYYSDRKLPSGGELYADITTGYGPECFTIAKPAAFPYTLQAHYYSRGPMGFGMGKLQIIEHDGAGKLSFEERPFVVMTDGAFVPLGDVAASAFE